MCYKPVFKRILEVITEAYSRQMVCMERNRVHLDERLDRVRDRVQGKHLRVFESA